MTFPSVGQGEVGRVYSRPTGKCATCPVGGHEIGPNVPVFPIADRESAWLRPLMKGMNAIFSSKFWSCQNNFIFSH